MSLKLKPQTPVSYPSSRDLEAESQALLTFTRTHSSNNMSELQEKFGAIMKRVIGETPSFLSSLSSFSSSSSSSSSSPFVYSPTSLSFSLWVSPCETPRLNDDIHSNYGDDEAGGEDEHDKTLPGPKATELTEKLTLSISSPSSYASLASLNPYTLDADDLAHRLSLITAEPFAREDRDKERLARQLDHAHESVKAEESAALQVLQQQLN
ncbi:hypothetical protein CIB48_g5177 [Xylaria polymorpha]|nr:hypothetical protein CIB48_g5177 [Xylaria polymorpha]